MSTVSALGERELAVCLRKQGIAFRIGPFVIQLRTRIPHVVEAVRLLYSEYPLAPPDRFADFHVGIVRPRGIRRWFRPQVKFLSDGDSTFKPLPYDQAFPMLEWGLNWYVSSHAHNYLMIHAAVIEKGGHAAILPAPPGSGKSTLCAALVNRGWRLLSDELTLIRVGDGKIIPVPRPVSLKNQSIQVIKGFAPGAVFSREVADTIKGTVAHMKAPADSVSRALEPASPGWVIFPKFVAGAPARLAPLTQAQGFMRVADNAFNYSLLGVKGFETLGGLIDQSLCYEFSYGALDDAIDTFEALQRASPPSPCLSHASRDAPILDIAGFSQS